MSYAALPDQACAPTKSHCQATMHFSSSSSAAPVSASGSPPQPKRVTKEFIFAFRVACVGSIGGLLFGYDLGVISIALPLISDEFHLTLEQESLVTSLFVVGALLGAVVGGYICDAIGRKFTVYLVSAVFILSSFVLSLSQSIAVLYIGRIIVGVGVAVSAIVDISYLTEISPLKYRGAVVTTNELMITIGLLLAFVIGFLYVNTSGGWRYMFGFPSVLAAIWVALICCMPESPRWLLLHNRREEAHQVYLKMTNSPDEAEKELKNAIDTISAMRQAAANISMPIPQPLPVSTSSPAKNSDSVAMISSQEKTSTNSLSPSSSTAISTFSASVRMVSEWRLSMTVTVVLMVLQNFSGNIGLLSYAPTIFAIGGYNATTSAIATVILGAVKVVFTAVSLSLVDHVGRRVLLLSGVFGMMISLFLLAILSVHASDISQDGFGTAVLILLCTFAGSYSIGFGPITWLIAAELFADTIRGRCIGLATIANWLSTLVVVGSFLTTVEDYGLSNTLISYGFCCAFGLVFAFFLVPETKLREPANIKADLEARFCRVLPRVLHKYLVAGPNQPGDMHSIGLAGSGSDSLSESVSPFITSS